MRVVIWLDDKDVGGNLPQIISDLADGMAIQGHQVELMVKTQQLDSFPVKKATKRAWFADEKPLIVADLLFSNSLRVLLDNQFQIEKLIWLVIDRDLKNSIEFYTENQLHDHIKVITLFKEDSNRLEEVGIKSNYLQPGLRLDKFKDIDKSDKKKLGMTIALFNYDQEILETVIEGIEKAGTALSRLQVNVMVDEKFDLDSNLSVNLVVNPTIDERLTCYKNSEALLYIPGEERISLIPLEAMASGVPVVLPGHPACGDYVKHEENAIILNELESTIIALALLNIIKIGQLRENLQTNGLQTAQKYNLEETLYQLKTIIQTNKNRDILLEKELDFVVINNSSENDLTDWLDELDREVEDSHQVFVMDNGNLDFTGRRGTKAIELFGTSGAEIYNQGMMRGIGKYICFLSSSLDINSNWFRPFLNEIKKPGVGMVIPTMIEEGEEESEKSIEEKKVPALFIKREVLGRIGPFDERLDHDLKNLDFKLRLEEKGYKVSHLPIIDLEFEVENNYVSEILTDSKRYFQNKWSVFEGGQPEQREIDGMVILGLRPWQKISQRTEAMIDYFIRQGQQIFYIEPYCSNLPTQDLGDGLYIYSFPGKGTINQNFDDHQYRLEMMRELGRELEEVELDVALLMVEAPFWEPFIKYIEQRYLVYVTPELLLSDDLESYRWLKENYAEEEESILKVAEMVLAGTQKRKEELKKFQKKLFISSGGFFPNDLERFLNQSHTVPDEFKKLSGPRVGIIGPYHHEFPRDFLKEIVLDSQGVSFVMIGEITRDLGPLKELPNLHLLGHKNWEEMLDCLYYLNLILHPYSDQDLNAYLDPYMVNYYLAMGKPILAFKHRELTRYGDKVIQFGDTDKFKETFNHLITRLDTEKDSEKIRDRIHQVRGNSWEEKLMDLYYELKSLVPIKKGKTVEMAEDIVEEEQETNNSVTQFFKQLFDSYQKLFRGHKK